MFLRELNEYEKKAFISLAVNVAEACDLYADEELDMVLDYCREMNIEFNIAKPFKDMDEIVAEYKDSFEKNKRIVLLEILGLIRSHGEYSDKAIQFMNGFANSIGLDEEDVKAYMELNNRYVDLVHEMKEWIYHARNKKKRCRTLVIGVGGAGNNAVNKMIEMGMGGVNFLPVAPDQLCIDKIDDYDVVIITCGMGGETGTEAAVAIAEMAKGMGILIMVVVTKPFEFEGMKRMEKAIAGIERISKFADTLIVISNDKIRSLPGYENLDLAAGISKSDEILCQTVKGISEILSNTSEINLDFRDLLTVMRDKGIAFMGIGSAEGNNKAETAIKMAVESSLLETTVKGSSDIIVFVRGKVTLKDSEIIGDYIADLVGNDANVIYGITVDESMGDTLSVSLMAMGMEA